MVKCIYAVFTGKLTRWGSTTSPST